MSKIIVTGIPHSGTSMLTEFLSKKYPGLPKKQLRRHGYNTYESVELQDGYDKVIFKKVFKSDYLWKTVYLPHQLHEIRKDLKPDKVYITIRDPLYHGNAIKKRYKRTCEQIAKELKESYPLLVRIACWFDVVVVQAEELAEHIKTNRLTADKTTSRALEELRADVNYHTLVELSRRREWLTKITE